MQDPFIPIKPKKQYGILTIIAVIFLIISMSYKFFKFKSNVVELNSPPVTPIWSEVAYNDISKIYVDLSNLKEMGEYEVDFWEKQEFTADFKVDESLNKGLILKFYDNLDNIMTHYLVDCSNRTYVFQNMLFTQKNGKVRFMETSEEMKPEKIDDQPMIKFSADYACDLRDMSRADRLATHL